MLLVLSCCFFFFLLLGVGWCGEGGGGEGTLFIAGWVGNQGWWRAGREGPRKETTRGGKASRLGFGARGRTGEGRFVVVVARAEGGTGGWWGGGGRRPGRPPDLGELSRVAVLGEGKEGGGEGWPWPCPRPRRWWGWVATAADCLRLPHVVRRREHIGGRARSWKPGRRGGRP